MSFIQDYCVRKRDMNFMFLSQYYRNCSKYYINSI